MTFPDTFLLQKKLFAFVVRTAFSLILLPRTDLGPAAPQLTAAYSTIDTVIYRKISSIECHIQITIEVLFNSFWLTKSVHTPKRKEAIFQSYIVLTVYVYYHVFVTFASTFEQLGEFCIIIYNYSIFCRLFLLIRLQKAYLRGKI